ncbi:MAG TPA: Wzz/FepE/Etk N-terminal domain-containing protein [Euzebya sp.]|nr:Wzz/FepE/Etk N-terminal domain-containing protein [Euzebya sp.]
MEHPSSSPVDEAHPQAETGSSTPDWALGPGLIQSIWRHRLLIVVAATLAGTLGYVVASLEPPTFQATARLLLNDPATVSVFSQDPVDPDPQRHLDNERQRVLSRPVLTLAAEALGDGATPEGLARRIQVEAADDADVLRVTASARSPQQAAAAADAVAVAYQKVAEDKVKQDLSAAVVLLDEQRTRLEVRLAESGQQLVANPDSPAALATVEAVTRQIAELDQLAAQLAVDAATFGSGVEAFETARVPEDAVAPNPGGTAAALGVLAFIAASVYAWWWAGRHLTVDDRLQPAAILNAPLLAQVPRFRLGRRSASGDPRRLFDDAPEVAEAYHMAFTALLARLRLPEAVVAITSATRDEGKTSVAGGVAAAAAHAHRVLLIDADVRTRRSTRLMATREAEGDDDQNLLAVTQRVSLTDDTRMWLLPASRQNRGIGESMRAMRHDLAEARRIFDLTVVDTAPILSVADTSALGSQVDGFVLVVRRGVKVAQLVELHRRLDVLKAPVLGYVFNDAASRPLRRLRRSSRGRHRKGRRSRS